MKKQKQLKNKKKGCKSMSSNKKSFVATDTDVVDRKEKMYYSVGLNK